jgi:hypothetical protein
MCFCSLDIMINILNEILVATKKYQLKNMPGDFTGMQLLSYMYVGFKQMEPGIDTGIDLEKEYRSAIRRPLIIFRFTKHLHR